MVRSKGKKTVVSDDELLSNLIIRLQKICSHSLAKPEMIEKYRHPYRKVGKNIYKPMGVYVTREGAKFNGKFSGEDLDKEKFESLAARCRPLTLQDGHESLRVAMDMVRKQVDAMNYSDEEKERITNEIDTLQTLWVFFSNSNHNWNFDATSRALARLGQDKLADWILSCRAFLVYNIKFAEDGLGRQDQEINILHVGYNWIYADLVHNGINEKREVMPHTENDRFECAIPYVFTILWLCTNYLILIKRMEGEILNKFNLSNEAKQRLQYVLIMPENSV